MFWESMHWQGLWKSNLDTLRVVYQMAVSKNAFKRDVYMIKEKGMSPNCSMISSEKKNQTSKSSTSQQPPGQKVFTNCQPAFLKHIFRAGRSWGKGNPIPFFTCPQPEGKAPPPVVHPSPLRLRFTLHLYRFVDTPRLTDCDVDGGREGGPGWIFTREVFFGVGFWVFPGASEVTKWEGNHASKLGIPRFWTKMVWSNCRKIVRSQMLKERQE